MPRKPVPPTPDQALWAVIRNGSEAIQSDAWVGSAVVSRASIEDARLYELAGLDEADWVIVGVELQTDGETSSMEVLATRRDSADGRSRSKRRRASSRVKLSFPDAEPYRLLKVATEVYSPAMRQRGGRIEIVDERDPSVTDG